MRLIRQPKDSNLCGQCVIAMILGISLAKAKKLIGHNGKTTIEELIQCLVDQFNCSNKLARFGENKGLPYRAIVRVTWNNRGSHWVLKNGKYIYDPALGKFIADNYTRWIRNAGRITSYCEIYEPLSSYRFVTLGKTNISVVAMKTIKSKI